MSLLKPAENQTAYLKAGILGFQGSGKTYTAANLALGLAKLAKSKSPKVAFFDTEKGSDFLIHRFKAAGVALHTAKSRAFLDLCDFLEEVEKESYDVAIIDSITHIWRDLMTSYQKKLNRKQGLQFQDWAAVKLEWSRFTDLFVNSKLHTIVLGRAGYEYEYDKDEETGRKELIKTGTKMKAEGEFGYESDLLLEMVLEHDKEGRKTINRCYVIKDRTDTMNGKVIDFPKFDDFKSVIEFLNLGGEHLGVDTTRDSQALFGSPDWSRHEQQKQRDIALEELQQELIIQGLDGRSQDNIQQRTMLLIEVFGTSAKTAIEGKWAEEIREGIKKMKAKFTEKKDQNLPAQKKEEELPPPHEDKGNGLAPIERRNDVYHAVEAHFISVKGKNPAVLTTAYIRRAAGKTYEELTEEDCVAVLKLLPKTKTA